MPQKIGKIQEVRRELPTNFAFANCTPQIEYMKALRIVRTLRKAVIGSMLVAGSLSAQEEAQQEEAQEMPTEQLEIQQQEIQQQVEENGQLITQVQQNLAQMRAKALEKQRKEIERAISFENMTLAMQEMEEQLAFGSVPDNQSLDALETSLQKSIEEALQYAVVEQATQGTNAYEWLIFARQKLEQFDLYTARRALANAIWWTSRAMESP
jgi:ribosomal protein L9